MPGVAVLVEPDERDAAVLVGLRQTIEPAIAFVAETVPHRVIEALEESDWRVVRVRRPASIGDAWAGIALRADIGAQGEEGGRDASR